MKRISLRTTFPALFAGLVGLMTSSQATAQAGLVSGTTPALATSEIHANVGVHSKGSTIEAGYRFDLGIKRTDFGLRVAALSRNEEATTLSLGVESRVLLNQAEHKDAVFPFDAALTLGAGFSVPNPTNYFTVVPVGITFAKSFPMDTDYEFPTSLSVYVHPRVEYTRRAGDCSAPSTEASPLACFTRVLFRSDLGITGDLSKDTRWFAAVGFGDTQVTGRGVSVGMATRW